MSMSGCYPCMDYEDPIRLKMSDKKVAPPAAVTKVFIEVQVREKRVYRTKSGLLLNHLHVSSPPKNGPRPCKEYLLSWRWFQIEFDDLLAKDVFHRCCDAESLLSMKLSPNKYTAARFVNFFKGRVSSFCNKNAASILETRPKIVVIITHITTVCVYDLGDDREALNSLKVCNKSCTREVNPYGATLLPKGAFLFSGAHGSLAYTDSDSYYHGQNCAVCLDELLVGSHDIIIAMCDHAYHSRCLIPWFNKVGSCPVCRVVLKNYITRKLPGCTC